MNLKANSSSNNIINLANAHPSSGFTRQVFKKMGKDIREINAFRCITERQGYTLKSQQVFFTNSCEL